MTRPLYWQPRSTVRWGDSFRLTVQAGAFSTDSGELVRVEAPAPCAWRLMFAGFGFLAGDNGSLRVLLDLGIGSVTSRHEGRTLVLPMAEPALVEVAAQTIIGRLRFAGTPLAARDLVGQLWAAPLIPWQGLEIGGCE